MRRLSLLTGLCVLVGLGWLALRRLEQRAEVWPDINWRRR
jgi:hypothetical protein